jgi:ribosome-associated protein
MEKLMSDVKTSAPTPKTKLEIRDALSCALACAKLGIDKKAENVRILDLSQLSAFTDYFVILNGASDRQVQAIADSIDQELREAGMKLLSVEGLQEGRWVLMDYGDVIVHIFLDALREYYDLERLWADAPRVKIPPEYYGPAASRLN